MKDNLVLDLATIESTLKKIDELLEEYEEIRDRVYLQSF